MGTHLTKKKKKKKTYELVDPMTICWVRVAALVVADDIAADGLGVVVVGIQTGDDDAPLCALGRQAGTRLWGALKRAFARAVEGVRWGGTRKDRPLFVERDCCMGWHPFGRTGCPSESGWTRDG